MVEQELRAFANEETREIRICRISDGGHLRAFTSRNIVDIEFPPGEFWRSCSLVGFLFEVDWIGWGNARRFFVEQKIHMIDSVQQLCRKHIVALLSNERARPIVFRPEVHAFINLNTFAVIRAAVNILDRLNLLTGEAIVAVAILYAHA